MDNKNQSNKYRIKVSASSKFWLSAQGAFDFVFNIFSLRKTKRFWGVVYDSVTKQPLDPAIVKLMYSAGGEVKTGVTDMAGRYGFFAKPGKFKILPRKANYLFPSKLVTGNSDGIYNNLYHGEFFEVLEDFEVVAPNIPMDPENFDWNQEAKQKISKAHPSERLFIKRLMTGFFWGAFAFCIFGFWKFYPAEPVWLYWIAGIFLAIFILTALLPEPRLWGRLAVGGQASGPGTWLLELHSRQFENVVFAKTEAEGDGKFLLRANKGKYKLWASKLSENKAVLFSLQMQVKVGGNGVLNSDLIVGSE